MDPGDLIDIIGKLVEINALAENDVLSEGNIDRIMREMDQDTWDDIKCAIVNHPEWLAGSGEG